MAGRRPNKGLKPKPPGGMSLRTEETIEFPKLLADSLCPLLVQMTNINQQLTMLNQKFAAQQLQLVETTKKTEQVAEKVLELDASSKKAGKKIQMLEKKQASEEFQLLQLQMERANMVLRFQGVTETPNENFKQLLSDALAPMTDLKAEDILSKMDVAYRAYSMYIKKNNLPGEIVVRFSKRHLRDLILKVTTNSPLKIGGNNIRILKDVPFEIRGKRKKYKDLILFLQTNSIADRWLIPEGVTFKIKEKREKNDSVFKAHEFLRLQLGDPEEDTKEEEDSKSTGELDSVSSDEGSDAEKGAAAPKQSYQLRECKEKQNKN